MDFKAAKAAVGAWRSLVAYLHGVQGVGGSNPLAPTIILKEGPFGRDRTAFFCLYMDFLCI